MYTLTSYHFNSTKNTQIRTPKIKIQPKHGRKGHCSQSWTDGTQSWASSSIFIMIDVKFGLLNTTYRFLFFFVVFQRNQDHLNRITTTQVTHQKKDKGYCQQSNDSSKSQITSWFIQLLIFIPNVLQGWILL